MRRGLEAVFVTLGGAGLGWLTGWLVGGVPFAIAGATSAGVNGAFGGFRQVYHWGTVAGWYAFVADSTWALVGTTLGVLLNTVNATWPNATFRADFSHRRNRHLYEKGLFLKRHFAFTQGQVISNAGLRRDRPVEHHQRFIDRHEDLHIWQNRWFGPIFQLMYVVWAAGGVLVAIGVGLAKRKSHPSFGALIQTAAYYDNPFEYWAYKTDEHWDDNGADPILKWG